ncbi:MAG: recombinase family protein [Clostridia bacterium]|nr:recombinase family protein [Oscillospiraceae bacterium]MBQ3551644.1 recombinase family protein [Clostridia bacterium]
MAYCLYLRKSRTDAEAEARGEGETLARHERTLLELAKRLQLNVTEIYREVVSGETIAARPVMQRLLSEVEQGVWKGVLVMEVERLARGDTIDQGIVAQTFKFSDTSIITPVKTFVPNNEFDEEYFEFGLFMSRREYKAINRRLQGGRLSSAKEGKYVGNKAPYGYRRIKIERDKGFTLEPVPDEADVVRLIFDLYTVGEVQPDDSHKRLGVSLIARRLDALRVPTRTGAGWSTATIRDILINPVYIGKIRWNWRPAVKKMVDGCVVVERPRASVDKYILVDGLHPAIISEETFNTAQELMRKNPPRPIGERNTVKNPLAGLVICAKCGRHMTRRPFGSNHAKDILMCAATSCDNVSCNLHYVEERILAGLAEWLSNYRLKWETGVPTSLAASQLKRKKNAAKRLRSELATLDKQLNNVHDLLEQGVYSTDQFLERSRSIAERTQAARDSLEAVEAEIVLETNREENQKNIIPKVERLLEVYHILPDAKAKNDMLKSVLEKAVYLREKSTRWRGSPDDFELVLYPKLPASHSHSNNADV